MKQLPVLIKAVASMLQPGVSQIVQRGPYQSAVQLALKNIEESISILNAIPLTPPGTEIQSQTATSRDTGKSSAAATILYLSGSQGSLLSLLITPSNSKTDNIPPGQQLPPVHTASLWPQAWANHYGTTGNSPRPPSQIQGPLGMGLLR